MTTVVLETVTAMWYLAMHLGLGASHKRLYRHTQVTEDGSCGLQGPNGERRGRKVGRAPAIVVGVSRNVDLVRDGVSVEVCVGQDRDHAWKGYMLTLDSPPKIARPPSCFQMRRRL